MTGTIKAYVDIGGRIQKASPGEMSLYYFFARGWIYTEPLNCMLGLKGKARFLLYWLKVWEWQRMLKDISCSYCFLAISPLPSSLQPLMHSRFTLAAATRKCYSTFRIYNTDLCNWYMLCSKYAMKMHLQKLYSIKSCSLGLLMCGKCSGKANSLWPHVMSSYRQLSLSAFCFNVDTAKFPPVHLIFQLEQLTDFTQQHENYTMWRQHMIVRPAPKDDSTYRH